MPSARTTATTLTAGALLAGALLAAPANAAATPPQQVLALVNQQRAAHGCGALAGNAALFRAAQDHSTDMARHGYMGHNGSDGSDPAARMAAAGFRATAWGEDVAAGQPSANAVVRAWMGSPEHRANILNCGLHDAGAGYGVNNGTAYHTYWTLDLASA